MSADCLFCKIIAKELPATIVFQDDRLTAIRDINPQAPTHILILPNRHISSMNDAGSDDADLLGRLLLAGAQLAREEGVAEDGYRLVVNTGPQAGQSVFHLHVHLIGGRSLSWPPG